MAVFLFTWHAYGSWMPDRPQGYVKRKQGVLPPDLEEAAWYRRLAVEDEARFDEPVQRTLIESVLASREPLALRTHAVATEVTHLHALVSWTTDRKWESMARSLRRSLTSTLFEQHGRRHWLSRGRDGEQVEDESHFEYLMSTYLPGHTGLFWSERTGWREQP